MNLKYFGKEINENSISCEYGKRTKSIDLKKTDGTINGHEYVDLGLSVMWATCNVGANLPTGCGKYYAWGEIRPKPTYTKANYIKMEKIRPDISGEANYDAARANWGSTWRMPTWEEIDELIDNCDMRWVAVNEVNGMLVTSKINGKSIFLPAASFRDDSLPTRTNDNGIYMTSSPCNDSSLDSDLLFSYCFSFDSEDFGRRYNRCDYGYSIRPVTDVESASLTD